MGWEAVDGAGARVSGDDVKIYVEKKNFIFSYSYLVYLVLVLVPSTVQLQLLYPYHTVSSVLYSTVYLFNLFI